jgi:hypothetical protein
VAAFTVTSGAVTVTAVQVMPATTQSATLPTQTTVATATLPQSGQAVKAAAATVVALTWELTADISYVPPAGQPTIIYRERFAGTYDQAVAKAQGRVIELAALKVQHDAVHARVVAMSEGAA